MTDFQKIKTGYVLALLAASFTVMPFIDKITLSVRIFGLDISLQTVFVVFSIMLFISVFCYSITYITDRNIFKICGNIGNTIYAISLMILPLYFVITILVHTYNLLSSVIDSVSEEALSIIINTVFLILGASSSIMFSIFAAKLRKIFNKNDKSSRIKLYSKKLNDSYITAKDFHNNKQYDLSVMQIWKSIELSILTLIDNNDLPTNNNFTQMLEQAKNHKLLDENCIDRIKQLRAIRNKSIHSDKITKEESFEALQLGKDIMLSLESTVEQCYFCSIKYSIMELEGDNATGAYVCKACSEKHPNWRDELFDLGMDP